MKILIIYYSETGNTEKVAKSIEQGILEENPLVETIENVDVNSLTDYDLIFFGIPTQGNALPAIAKRFLKACPENLPCKFAIFFTHSNSDKSFYSGTFKAAAKILGNKNIAIVDQFHCIGEHKNEQVIQILRVAMPDKIDELLKNAKGHPNKSDLTKANEFSKKVLEKLSVEVQL